MQSLNGVYKGGVYNRRMRALGRLEEQLKLGRKPALLHVEGSGSSTWGEIPLEEKDITRIKKEILILKDKT